MRHPALLILTWLVSLSVPAPAAEVATDDLLTPGDAVSERITPDAEPTPDESIPSFDYYDRKIARDRGRCGYAWRDLRHRAVNVRPVAAPFATIRANARRVGISDENLERTYKTFIKNQSSIPNQRYITVIDFTKRSNERRLFTIDLSTGLIQGHAVAAGMKSDPDKDGYATHFDNRREGNASSLGCYMVYGTYAGGRFGKDNTMMLHGFEPSNDNACARSLIMHPRWYVGQVPGRSNGCFAVKPNEKDQIFAKMSGGLVCAYHDGARRSARSSVSKKRRTSSRHASARRTYTVGGSDDPFVD